MNSLVFLAVLCSVLAVNIQAVQHNRLIGVVKMDFDPITMSMREYCVENEDGEEWEINESKFEDCFMCQCSVANRGILCTGVGYQDGVLPPAGCLKRHLQTFEMQGNETCCYQMVNADNQAETCGEKVCA